MSNHNRKIFMVNLNNSQMLFAIAHTHTEAIQKVEKKINVDDIFKRIITSDGLDDGDLEIISVVKLCDEIVF